MPNWRTPFKRITPITTFTETKNLYTQRKFNFVFSDWLRCIVPKKTVSSLAFILFRRFRVNISYMKPIEVVMKIAFKCTKLISMSEMFLLFQSANVCNTELRNDPPNNGKFFQKFVTQKQCILRVYGQKTRFS